jgi:uncharacterized membrane protein
MRFIVLFLVQFIFVVAFLVIGDSIWFQYLAGDTYQKDLHTLLIYEDGQLQIRPLPTVGVYLTMALMISLFALDVNSRTQKITGSSRKGILLGALTYGVYEFTNYAVLKDWTSSVVLPDIVWGSILFGSTSFLTHISMNTIKKFFKIKLS